MPNTNIKYVSNLERSEDTISFDVASEVGGATEQIAAPKKATKK